MFTLKRENTALRWNPGRFLPSWSRSWLPWTCTFGLRDFGRGTTFQQTSVHFQKDKAKHKPNNYTNEQLCELKTARMNSNANTHVNELETKGAQPPSEAETTDLSPSLPPLSPLPLPFPFSFLSSAHLYLKGTYQLLCGCLAVMRLPKCDSLICSPALQIAKHWSSSLGQLISAKLLWFLFFWERNELLCQQLLSCQCYSPAKQRAWKLEFC